jgi:tetratricopeptide (TPR) repeat protein
MLSNIKILEEQANKGKVKALNDLGLHYLGNDVVKAVEYLTAAADLNYQPACNNLAAYYLSIRNIDIAFNYLIKALILRVDQYVLNNLGFYYLMIGDYNLAKNNFELAIQHGCINIKTLFNIGICLRNLGEYDKAVARFKKLIKMNHHCAAMELVNYYYSLGDYLKSAKYFVIALDIISQRLNENEDNAILFQQNLHYYNSVITIFNDFLSNPFVKTSEYYIDILIIASRYKDESNTLILSNLIKLCEKHNSILAS